MASNLDNHNHNQDDDYESDPDDSLLPALRRRQAASDDEDEDDHSHSHSDQQQQDEQQDSDDDDAQGGVEAYDDDNYDDQQDEQEDDYEEDYEEDEAEDQLDQQNNAVPLEGGPLQVQGEGQTTGAANVEDNKQDQGQKKESEPYAVPTSGAFYMHDDRFQDNNARGAPRRRRMYGGGRKIWNPKDERDWVHDRFEEMTVHESRRDDDRRRPRGRYRGRGGGGGRGPRRVGGSGERGGGDRGSSYARGGRGSRPYYDDGQNNNKPTRTMRGRGQRQYEPVNRNNPRNQPPQEKQILQRTNEQGPNPSATGTGTNTRQHSQGQKMNTFSSSLPKKQTFSSSLNSASPPFYPSNTSNSNQDPSTAMRRDAQNSGPTLSDSRGKSIAVGSTIAPNSATTAVRVQGKGVMGSDNQIPRGSSQAPFSMGQNRQVSVTTNHKFAPASVQPVSGTSSGMGEDTINSGSPTNKLKGGISASKGKSLGSGALMYGGAQVIGTTGPMSMPHGEQGFPGTPALLPVMQFSGQHHGVPAVGMALPGYVAQSQLGFGNSEMTWVPVLAGSAGSLGGSYCPPYIALDGGYYNNGPHSTSEVSSSASSREAAAAKSSHGSKSSQKPEVPAEEPGQRQNKPRRYSEMNFGQ